MAGKPDFSEIPDNIFSLGQPASEPATYPAQLDSAARRNKPTAHAIGTPVAHSFKWPAGSSLDSGGLAATGTPKVKRWRGARARPGQARTECTQWEGCWRRTAPRFAKTCAAAPRRGAAVLARLDSGGRRHCLARSEPAHGARQVALELTISTRCCSRHTTPQYRTNWPARLPRADQAGSAHTV